MNALFLGYGRMGRALGDAWLTKGLLQSIDAVEPFTPIQNPAVQAFQAASEIPTDRHYDVLILAVKPSMLQHAVSALKPELIRSSVVISVMAGVTIDTLRHAFPSNPIVRVMPNTAVLVGAGCTGLYASHNLTDTQRHAIADLFAAVGTTHWVNNEDHLHIITALSGSGPAYYHLFSEALANAGQALGLDASLAHAIAAQTCLGAASLQTQADADFVQLRADVTSPNGTTHAAIQVFEEAHALRSLIDAAVHAAARRSEELSL